MPEKNCLNQVLQSGDTGPCVRYLQELLRDHGGFGGAVDGVMGEGTSQALRRFQQQSGLEPTGKTEPVTWELLMTGAVPATPPPRQRCRLLRLGDEGPDVAAVQGQLERLGYDAGLVDGIYGLLTEQAVRRWQQVVGLPANGVMGRRAWDRLGFSCQDLEQPAQHELAPVLHPGDQGRSVVLLQALLLAAGFDPGGTDGVYGHLTAAAVGALQKASGLDETRSVDARVWGVLGLPADQHREQSPTARLRYGSRGPRVRDLQVLLLEMGFDPGELDGIFGAAVRAAVMQLQAAMGLQPTGKMGRDEWQALGVNQGGQDRVKVELSQSWSAGDRGPAVEALQRLLHEIGYDPGPVDGIYGPLTESAILLLQRCEGLPLTGITDQPTWDALW